MSILSATRPQPRNRLLAALPPMVYERMLPHLEVVTLPAEQILCEAGGTILHAYFPGEGVVCDIALLKDRRMIDVGTTGNEGLVGLPLFLGSGVSANRTMTQVPGEALRMTAAAFRGEADRPGPLHGLLLRYANAVLFATGQSVACNNHHTVLQRCCRWLLMTRDRMSTDRFPLTQAMLAKMLGVRRLSVSEAQAHLQEAGRIRYSRGSVLVLDREGLEGDACECYRRVKDEFARLLG